MASGPAGRLPHVLVVDDAEDTRVMYALYLQHAGLQVDEASDGPEALGRAIDRRPDIVVIDLAMPKMDGLTLTRQLKANPRTAAIRVIAVTGHRDKESENEALAAGCDAFLIKPCLPEQLLAEIRRQLASRLR